MSTRTHHERPERHRAEPTAASTDASDQLDRALERVINKYGYDLAAFLADVRHDLAVERSDKSDASE